MSMSPLPKLAPLSRAVNPEVVVDNLKAHPQVFVPRIVFAAYLMVSLQEHKAITSTRRAANVMKSELLSIRQSWCGLIGKHAFCSSATGADGNNHAEVRVVHPACDFQVHGPTMLVMYCVFASDAQGSRSDGVKQCGPPNPDLVIGIAPVLVDTIAFPARVSFAVDARESPRSCKLNKNTPRFRIYWPQKVPIPTSWSYMSYVYMYMTRKETQVCGQPAALV